MKQLPLELVYGQDWAVAREGVWRETKMDLAGPAHHDGFEMAIVVCHTTRFDRVKLRCKKYGGATSFDRCIDCGDKERVTYSYSQGLPKSPYRLVLIRG